MLQCGNSKHNLCNVWLLCKASAMAAMVGSCNLQPRASAEQCVVHSCSLTHAHSPSPAAAMLVSGALNSRKARHCVLVAALPQIAQHAVQRRLNLAVVEATPSRGALPWRRLCSAGRRPSCLSLFRPPVVVQAPARERGGVACSSLSSLKRRPGREEAWPTRRCPRRSRRCVSAQQLPFAGGP